MKSVGEIFCACGQWRKREKRKESELGTRWLRAGKARGKRGGEGESSTVGAP